jgi:hypothetical protein
MPTVSESPISLTAGDNITVSWSGISSPTGTDWVGVFTQPSDPASSYLNYVYTGGTANGSAPLLVPSYSTPGQNYEVRLYANNSFSLLATSTPAFTVNAPLAAIATRVAGQLAGSTSYGYVDHTDPLQAKFWFPADIRLSPDETRMYVADLGNHAIRWIDMVGGTGVHTLYAGAPLKSPYHIHVNPVTGNLWVTNTWSGTDPSEPERFTAVNTGGLSIVRITPGGTATEVFHGNYPSAQPMWRPRGVVCDTSESSFWIWQDGSPIFISGPSDFIQPKLTLMDSAANFDADYGTVGTSWFNETADVCMDKNGNNWLYWTQYQFDATGVHRTDLGASPTTETRLLTGDTRGIWTTHAKLYRCDTNGHIGVADLDGSNEVVWSTLLPGDTKVSYPVSIVAPDSDAFCYISDSYIARSGGYWGYTMGSDPLHPTYSNHCIWKIELGGTGCPPKAQASSQSISGPARVWGAVNQRVTVVNGPTAILESRNDPCHPTQQSSSSRIQGTRIRLKRPG